MHGVLVADDDGAFREQLASFLAERFPHLELVASVADGHRAVACAMELSPAVVLIDYAMPGPNGGHAAAVIRQALPGTHVVILSGYEDASLVDVPLDVAIIHKGAGMEEALAAALAAQD
jgi:DNA-binding NarL/FixJ family response regulator